MTRIPLRKESIIYILVLGIISLIIYFILPVLSIIPLLLPMFVIYFFMDEEIIHQLICLVARTIVSWSKVGNKLGHGERYGLIKFGSCTEIIFPCNTEVMVKKGDIVRGGISVIGVVK